MLCIVYVDMVKVSAMANLAAKNGLVVAAVVGQRWLASLSIKKIDVI